MSVKLALTIQSTDFLLVLQKVHVLCHLFQGKIDLRWLEAIYLHVGYVFESGFWQE